MFFRRKPKQPSKRYVAYLHKMAKYRLVMSRFAEEPGQQLLIYFFDQTRKEIQQMAAALNITLKNPGEHAEMDDLIFCNAFSLNQYLFPGITKVVVMEVHPLHANNEAIVQHFINEPKLEIEFHMGFDEAALKPFNSERLSELMVKLGMGENEPIEHSMVSKSLENGLTKLEAKLKNSHQDIRSSQEEWVVANKL